MNISNPPSPAGRDVHRIAVGADHAGYRLKNHLAALLLKKGLKVRDMGTDSPHSCDYPDFARAVANAVASGEVDLGLLVCGTGQGMAMTANKVPGVRAAVVLDTFSARAAREHNDCNVLCLGARVCGTGLAEDLLNSWLAASFQGGRHQARVRGMELSGGGV